MTTFDFSELSKLAADLGEAPETMRRNVISAVKFTSFNVKRDWQAPLKGSEMLPKGAYTITYDIGVTDSEITSEIGPKLGGVGGLVGVLEYGTPTTPPTGYGHAALQKNEEDFVKGIGLAAGDIL